MVDFTYESQGANTYLVYTIKPDDTIDSMSLGMLTNNKIFGLAQTSFMQMDTTKCIKYNVSSKVSVKQFFSGAVNKKRLLGVFKGIVEGLLAAEDYMLDPNSIILDTDYIFADVSSCDATLICLPICSTEMPNMNLGFFFKNIMMNTQFDSTENSDHVAKIFNFLNSSPVFSSENFKKLLDELDGNSNSVASQPKAPTQEQPKVSASSPTVSAAAEQPVQPPHVINASVQTQPVVPPKAVETPQFKQPQTSISQVPPVTNVPPEQTQPKTEGKKMSMFGLMMHYSKENAELYKAQKAQAKMQGNSPKAPTQTPPKGVAPGFAVPGQKTAPNPGFAIPGQQTPPQPVKQNIPVPAKQPVAPMPQNTPQASQNPVPVQQPVNHQPAQPTYTPPVSQGSSMNFGETTVLGGAKIGETTVLSGGMQPQQKAMPHLIRTKNNERIELNKPVFRIGKEKSYVDYFISDNTAVSRSHANIITREGQYFITDTNSTNHTFVNGKMIQSNIEVEIKHGDKIRLGNEDFEFKLY